MFLASCHTAPTVPTKPAAPTVPAAPTTARNTRPGDEIIVAGKRFHTGTRVITWMEPGGYNAYEGVKPLNPRLSAALSPKENARVQKTGWDVATLRKTIDQFVLHYDGCGFSKICFKTLRERGLNVHFLLDLDGTIYQTLDLKERATHATIANDRSIGIEIANLGAYAPGDTKLLAEWYQRDASGRIFIKVPKAAGDPQIYTPNFMARPARPGPIRGALQGKDLVQYDFTPEQYAALAKLTATLCTVFPGIKCDFPRDRAGRLITQKLPDDALAKYQGILGHWHIQTNKTDPGPALQWSKIISEARPAKP